MTPPPSKGRSKGGSSKPAEQARSESNAIDLTDLATALANALLGAKGRLDQEAIVLADQYRADPVLRFLPPPAFAIGEARVVIKFAIADTEPSPSPGRGEARVRVHVDAASLHDLAPHLVSEIELRITPQATRAHTTEAEQEAELEE